MSAEIIPLRQDGLGSLFADTLKASAPPALNPALAAQAARLHAAGADPASIAGQLGVPLSHVLPMIDRHREAQESAARARKRKDQAARDATGLVHPASTELGGPEKPSPAVAVAALPMLVDDTTEEAPYVPAPIEVSSAPPPTPKLEVSVWPASWTSGTDLSSPDAELSPLQQKALRYARAKVGISVEMLARAARTNPDHIRRICGEAPSTPTSNTLGEPK